MHSYSHISTFGAQKTGNSIQTTLQTETRLTGFSASAELLVYFAKKIHWQRVIWAERCAVMAPILSLKIALYESLVTTQVYDMTILPHSSSTVDDI